ncbi:MAG: hypothetical protein Q8M79_04390 [Dehalococcoidia bacterium]|nr:hypothetical protein [Dehalococcoidia bacterium]
MTNDRTPSDAPEEREASEDRFDPPPAPVVTEEGVYGTPRQMTVRDLERTRYRGSRPWLATVVLAFALATAAWLTAFTTAQVTGPAVAIPVIGRGLEALTGLEALLVLHQQEIKIAAAAAPAPDAPVAVPGFEVRGATLTRAGVQAGGPADWYPVLLDASATAIHRDGIEVLALTNQATGGGWFSTPGGTRLLMHTLSDTNHGRAVFGSWLMGALALVLGGLVVLAGNSLGRIQALGVGLVLAAIPVAAGGLLGIAVVAFAGSDGSPLAETISSMAGEVARAPLRNAITLAGLGLVIAVPALAARLILERMPEPLADGGPA